MPHQQVPGIPGVTALTDTLAFVKNMWGNMGVPGMVLPTVSVEDLDKKISDMKAVESWLNLNMSMLRGTIQTMEVQRATLASLKSMNATMQAAMKTASEHGFKPVAPADISCGAAAASDAPDQPLPSGPNNLFNAPMFNPAAWWTVLQDQFGHAVSNALSEDAAGKKLADNMQPNQSGQPAQSSEGAATADDEKIMDQNAEDTDKTTSRKRSTSKVHK